MLVGIASATRACDSQGIPTIEETDSPEEPPRNLGEKTCSERITERSGSRYATTISYIMILRFLKAPG
jgi:hypothetical protein